MSLLANERARYDYQAGMEWTECLCPYCLRWSVVWGGESVRRGRRVCSYCTWVINDRNRRKWGCIA